MGGLYDEGGYPSEDLVMSWNEHNDHADGHDPRDGETSLDDTTALALAREIAVDLDAVRAAAERVRQTALSGDDYEQARAGFVLAERFAVLDGKLSGIIPAADEGADG